MGALLWSCKPTRLLHNDEYLLQKNKIEIKNSEINKKDLESYYRQEPNRKLFLFLKFHLAAYNFSQLGKERKWKNWIARVIGEEPSVYDSVLVDQTIEQFHKYLKNEAFYEASITSNVELKRKRAWVKYSVDPGNPVIVKNVYYQIEDSNLINLIYSDTVNSAIIIGERMTVNALEAERKRLVTQMRDSGYYGFKNEFIRYQVDTFYRKANITLLLEQVKKQDSSLNLIQLPHKQYWINKVFFMPDFEPQLALKNRQSYFQTFDTTYYKGFGFIYSKGQNVKPKVILKANTIIPGEKYNFSKVNSTTRYFNSLKLFRLNNLGFYPDANNDTLVNCVVQLSPAVYQNYSVNFESTHTEGNFGLGGYVNYQHKNLMRGAEILNVKVSGSLQRQSKVDEVKAFNIFEYGAELGLETPSFILPFRMERFYKKYNPKTNFLVAYNHQQRPDYIRTISSLTMGYDWKGTVTTRHFLNPIDLNLVDVDGSTEFFESKKGTLLENSFKDYLIAGGNYSFIYQNKTKTGNRDFSYLRMNLGVAGNLLHFTHDKLGLKRKENDGFYTMFEQQYAQYFRLSADYRYNLPINKDNHIVSRFFGGIAYPYGNSTAIPFVKQYFAGGADGIRAWSPRNLGPGTYTVPDSISSMPGYYPNLLGDIKLEFNLEYRYSLNKSWKGALFVDVGNIWLRQTGEPSTGKEFYFDTFYKQLAVGTGFGIRYDLEFAVFRLDYGIKVRDPRLTGPESWVLFQPPFIPKNLMVWHFAVGYPF